MYVCSVWECIFYDLHDASKLHNLSVYFVPIVFFTVLIMRLLTHDLLLTLPLHTITYNQHLLHFKSLCPSPKPSLTRQPPSGLTTQCVRIYRCTQPSQHGSPFITCIHI